MYWSRTTTWTERSATTPAVTVCRFWFAAIWYFEKNSLPKREWPLQFPLHTGISNFFAGKYVNNPAISKNYTPNHNRIVDHDLGRKTSLVQDFQSEMVTNSIRAIRKQGYWRQLWFAVNSFSRNFFLLRKLVSWAGQINFFFQSVIIGYIFYRTILPDITTGNIANTSLAYEMISQSLTWLSIALVVGTFVRLINLLDSEESGANNKTSLTEVSILTISNSVHPQIMG